MFLFTRLWVRTNDNNEETAASTVIHPYRSMTNKGVILHHLPSTGPHHLKQWGFWCMGRRLQPPQYGGFFFFFLLFYYYSAKLYLLLDYVYKQMNARTATSIIVHQYRTTRGQDFPERWLIRLLGPRPLSLSNSTSKPRWHVSPKWQLQHVNSQLKQQ